MDGLGVSITGDISLRDSSPAFSLAISQLRTAEDDLLALITDGKVRSIEIPNVSGTTYYSASDGEVKIATFQAEAKNVANAIAALQTRFTAQTRLGIPVAENAYELDANYIKCVQRLQSRLSAIAAKKRFINEIQFVDFESSFSYQTLRIGATGPVEALDRVIQSIQ
jgi:hypothetical protein